MGKTKTRKKKIEHGLFYLIAIRCIKNEQSLRIFQFSRLVNAKDFQKKAEKHGYQTAITKLVI